MTSPESEARRSALLLGAATVIAQAVLLREAMAALGGSETAWGFVMALWLAGMGIGARIGVRAGSDTLARWLPIAVLLLAGGGVVALRAAPALLGLASGEALITTSALWLWALAVLPSATAGGLAFPVLAERLGGGGRAYALEASGALIGGIGLSAMLIGLGSAAAVLLSLGAATAATLWNRRRILSCLLLLGAIAAAGPAGDLLARAGWQWKGHTGPLDAWKETRLQRLEKSGSDPTSIFGDGRLVASYPDPYSTLPLSHLVMLIHPTPRRIFAVGSAGDGSIEAMIRHPVEHLVVVEEDPEFLHLIPAWYGSDMGAALTDPRIRLVATDPIRALSRTDSFDLIVLADSDPTTLRRNRTRTVEFFQSCSDHLDPAGIVVLPINISNTYLGGAGGRLASTLAATIREIFPQTAIIPGQRTLLIAGGVEADLDLDPGVLADRLADRRIEDPELIPEMIPVLLDLDRAREIEGHLDPLAPLNTVRAPRAVVFAGGLHEGRSGPSLLNFYLGLEEAGSRPFVIGAAVGVALLLIPALVGRAAEASTALVVGFGSMGWWLLLIATWQSTQGSVYSEVGALTALFMAGLALGAMILSRSGKPERAVPMVLVAGSAVSIMLAFGLALATPRLVVPVVLALTGLITGAAFPGLTRLGSRDTRRSAGVVFAFDEAGAAAAAIAIGIFAIPWAGLALTAWGLAVLQLAAIPAVVVALRRTRN